LETDRYHKWERGNENYKNYTHLNPYANNLEKMSEDIYNLKIGNHIYQVDYDHSTGKFTNKEKIESKQNIIICGLHTLYIDKINNISDIKIYMDTDRDLIKEWKINRDVNERGYSMDKILNQINTRQTDYDKYISIQKNNADIIINFYKCDNKLYCNFIIQNMIFINKISSYLITHNYKVTNINNNIYINLYNDNSFEYYNEIYNLLYIIKN
jgi:uridine kinase